MITIISVDNKGSVVSRDYDNRKCKFFIDNKVIDLSEIVRSESNSESCDDQPDSKSINEREFNCISAPYKNANFKTLKIQLGLGCNFNCSYCKQRVHADDAVISNTSDVIDFISSFKTWCHNTPDHHFHIQLWGGEPLLYMKKIRMIVDYFKVNYNCSFSVVSNGYLLTNDIVDYFLDNNVQLVVSHDGENNDQHRSKDPLFGEPLEAMRRYHKRSNIGITFNSVLTKDNIDVVGIRNYLIGFFDDRINSSVESIVNIEDPDQFDDEEIFATDDYTLLRDTIKSQLVRGDLKNISPFGMKFQELVGSWADPEYFIYDNGLQKCGMDDPYTIAVDLKGNVLGCQSNGIIVGSTKNLKDINIYDSINLWKDRERCRECLVLSICKGSCMLLSGEAFSMTCDNEFHFHLAIFEALFESVFNETIIHIDHNISLDNNHIKFS